MDETWQVMRLSSIAIGRHPICRAIQRLAERRIGMRAGRGIDVGDMSQPARRSDVERARQPTRGALDAEFWLTPMPDRRWSRDEREEKYAGLMVRARRLAIDPGRWDAEPISR